MGKSTISTGPFSMSQTVSLPEGTPLKPHGLSSFPPLHNITHKISKMFLHTGIPNYFKKQFTIHCLNHLKSSVLMLKSRMIH